MTRSSWLLTPVLLSIMLFGCSGQNRNLHQVSEATLKEAVSSMSVASSGCIASEYSTEDESILALLQSAAYSVISGEADRDEDGAFDEYLLRLSDGRLVAARIYVQGGRCRDYSFSQVIDDHRS